VNPRLPFSIRLDDVSRLKSLVQIADEFDLMEMANFVANDFRK
jgi:hypothetical protein